ncbi:uncharacterized protein [Syngnathus scovelli]|uniref:uncharacterized protein n=1 Tax=Syngnathus scovelli TaxID=161590 RepID=UPI00210FD282|nr:uncharacterized protein LOC125986639 [Syngnathus scovelli]
MCKVQMLRALVNERLNVAMEEIFELFVSTIAEYEEQLCRSKEEIERQRQLLDAVFVEPVEDGIHRADVLPEQQQQRRQHDAEPPSVKKDKKEETEEDEQHSRLPSVAPERQHEAALLCVKKERNDEEDHARETLAVKSKRGCKRKLGSGLGEPVRVADVSAGEDVPSGWEDAVELADDSSSSTSVEDDRRRSSSYAWTRADKGLLAAFFEEYPMFYNSCLDEFKDHGIKRAVVRQFVKEHFEHKGRPAPSYEQVMGFLKNYRTRFVKLSSKKGADEHLTATERWILDNFDYLRPHIKKRRGRVARQFPSEASPRAARDDRADKPAPSACATCGAGGQASTLDAKEPPPRVRQQRGGRSAAFPDGEPKIQTIAQYLRELMTSTSEDQT